MISKCLSEVFICMHQPMIPHAKLYTVTFLCVFIAIRPLSQNYVVQDIVQLEK